MPTVDLNADMGESFGPWTMGDDASLASAGLVMAIVGGALMPPLQASMIDAGPILGDIPSVKTSFLMPLLCFVVIAVFGFRAHRVHDV